MCRFFRLITFVMGVGIMNGMASDLSAEKAVRTASVAGTFYESNPLLLRDVVLRYLSEGKPYSEPVRLLIVPHAGYVFSGPVAARGYAALDTRVQRVIILGPSHYKAFKGIAVPQYVEYATPLGRVPIDRTMVEALKKSPFVKEADGFDDPEHCLEVQLPFLQVKLGTFTLVPLLCGEVNPEKIAQLLLPFIDSTTALIVSSDLSHYKTQVKAEESDKTTIAAILDKRAAAPLDACGAVPIRIIMHCAEQLHLEPVLVDARTSFDTAPKHCPETRVVGYASIAYLTPEKAEGIRAPGLFDSGTALGDDYTSAQKKLLLTAARSSLEAGVNGGRFVAPESIPDALMEQRGCFVTLTLRGALRGCIGYIEPIKPLYEAVVDNAKNAALRDPRFSPVSREELASIRIEISVLTKPQLLVHSDPDDLLNRLVPGRDGVILRSGAHHSTYLPQVWEQLPGKVSFLEQLSLKGGMLRDGWKNAEVKTYRAVHFSE